MSESTDNNPIQEDPWLRRSMGLSSVESALGRAVSEQDVRHLKNLHPYLQIKNTGSTPLGLCDAVVKNTQTGWVMHDYFDAIATAPADFLGAGYLDEGKASDDDQDQDDQDEQAPEQTQKGADAEEGEEDSGIGELERTSGNGSPIKQAIDTAQEIVELVQERGWEGIEILSDHELMQWATWIAAQDHNLPTVGFEPTDEQKAKYERIKRVKNQGLGLQGPGVGMS
jgi:hypothetical protein